MAIEFSSLIDSSKLLAAVDMGTNSFKMIVVRAEPNGKFLAIDRLKEPVVLGRGMLDDACTISPVAQSRAITALWKFGQVLKNQRIDQTRIVATSAVREALNRDEFLYRVREELGFEIDVLSGEEEARLVYLGVLQFLPVYNKSVLTVDIGGGSTEFVIGKEGKVIFATSLKLGHVSLTEAFVKNGEIARMREHIRSVLQKSGLIEKVSEIRFEIAVGSSGTIRSIEKAVFFGYARDLMNAVVSFGDFRRDLKFNKEELSHVVAKLCSLNEERQDEEVRRVGFFKRRAEFIIAGAVLLLEIFETLNINEMQVSGYALGEGVIAETLVRTCENYDATVNARWRSIVHLATRFNSENKMKSAAHCVGIAKDIFVGVKNFEELKHTQNNCLVSFDEMGLEYLEAACLLHNIGLFTGKKGYHKQSYRIIKNGDLLGYNTEEVELIALLARHHRKKFPSNDHSSLQGFSNEVKQRFRILCTIIRLSVVIQQCKCVTFQGLEISHSRKGFILVLREVTNGPLIHGNVSQAAKDIEIELKPELERFKEVFQHKLSVAFSSRTEEPSRS